MVTNYMYVVYIWGFFFSCAFYNVLTQTYILIPAILSVFRSSPKPPYLGAHCTHCYTQAIARCTIETMAVASSEGCLLLALGTTAGGVFVVAVAAKKALVWVTLDTGSCKGTVKRCTHVL